VPSSSGPSALAMSPLVIPLWRTSSLTAGSEVNSSAETSVFSGFSHAWAYPGAETNCGVAESCAPTRSAANPQPGSAPRTSSVACCSSGTSRVRACNTVPVAAS